MQKPTKALTTPVETPFQRGVFARYGFSYDPRNNPPLVDMPQARPLYIPFADIDNVKDHGEWCLAKCTGLERRAQIQEILDAHERGE